MGTVFKVEQKGTLDIYAMKETRIPKDVTPQGKIKYLQEVNIMKQIEHPNIIKFHSCLTNNQMPYIYIIMEYAAKGDLHHLVTKQRNKGKYFSEKEIWSFAWQMCLGLLHLHSHDIIHRDIKCLNVLMMANN